MAKVNVPFLGFDPMTPYYLGKRLTTHEPERINPTSSRRALSQFWSFQIRRSTFLNYIKFADPEGFWGSKIVKGLVGHPVTLFNLLISLFLFWYIYQLGALKQHRGFDFYLGQTDSCQGDSGGPFYVFNGIKKTILERAAFQAGWSGHFHGLE